MSDWLFGSKPWWKFWDPRSSFAGGLVMAVVFFIMVFAVIAVFELLR